MFHWKIRRPFQTKSIYLRHFETLRLMLRKLAFEDMKQNALEQKALFSEKFDGFFKSVEKVRELQSMILGEFKSLQSVAFFIAAVCTCYFFTSTPRTAAARLPLFIGLFVVMFIERLVTSWGVTDTQSTDTVSYHSRPQRSHSSWSAPRIATSGWVQHRKSAIHRLPVTLCMLESSLTNLIGSGLNLLCLQSHSKLYFVYNKAIKNVFIFLFLGKFVAIFWQLLFT